MVRPHAEHFCYKTADFEAMKATLNSLKASGADGFVFGILNRSPQGSYDSTIPWIDVSRNKELIRLAEGRPCTFHRAFDLIPETHWETALADIMDCGFVSILTNGGPSGTEAADCVGKLQTLVRWSQTQLSGCPTLQCRKIPGIIVGGGVRASNIVLLHGMTGATVFHSAAIQGSSELVCEDEVLNMKSQIAPPQLA
jgi:copper homeostasis protein